MFLRLTGFNSLFNLLSKGHNAGQPVRKIIYCTAPFVDCCRAFQKYHTQIKGKTLLPRAKIIIKI